MYCIVPQQPTATATARPLRFDAYDADAYAPCRYHMLRRVQPDNASLVSTPQPGGKARWQLPGDGEGLRGMGGMMLRAQRMCRNYLTYNLLQGIVILLLIFHFIHYIGFQPRLALYPGEGGGARVQMGTEGILDIHQAPSTLSTPSVHQAPSTIRFQLV